MRWYFQVHDHTQPQPGKWWKRKVKILYCKGQGWKGCLRDFSMDYLSATDNLAKLLNNPESTFPRAINTVSKTSPSGLPFLCQVPSLGLICGFVSPWKRPLKSNVECWGRQSHEKDRRLATHWNIPHSLSFTQFICSIHLSYRLYKLGVSVARL